jgi:DNA end-binding protein Ku
MTTTNHQTTLPSTTASAPSRAIWKGTITWGMIAVPVRVLSAVNERDITFTSIHKGCGARFKQERKCPVHGIDIPADEVQTAYEVAKDQYVAISDDEIDNLPMPAKREIKLEACVPAGDVPRAMHEKAYYVQPDQIGMRSFSLLVASLTKKKRVALARICLRTRERLCVLRPVNGSLVLETLLYPEELRAQPVLSLVGPTLTKEEIKVAGMLIDTLSKPFVMSDYKDMHRAAVLEVVQKALESSDIKKAPSAGEAPEAVTDLMAQLRASIEMMKPKDNPAA